MGQAGEDHVCRTLAARGWQIIERNARTRFGELDVIAMTPQRTLAFVEVKTLRAGARRGPVTPVESVGPRKAARIRRLAAAWLRQHPGTRACAIRFDVAGVEVSAAGQLNLVQYIEAAF